jgi:AraC-like DNA-binding protein
MRRFAVDAPSGVLVELHLVHVFCSIRQGEYAAALRELDAADKAALGAGTELAARVHTWRAEVAFFQGRYSEASETIDCALPRLEQCGDLASVAFALRIRIAILLARTDYTAIAAIGDRSLRAAEASGDAYVLVQMLNVLGAAHFDRATSKLKGLHARAHLSALDANDTAPIGDDALEALRLFERAKEVAEKAKYEFAAWYVAGNIERLQILLGQPDRAVPAMRRRLGILQARGARYDEITTRSNLAWALRNLGHYRDALHELNVAMKLVRETGTFSVLLEFLEYDRSIVLDALGDRMAARASYRRYLQLVGSSSHSRQRFAGTPDAAAPRLPLEPYLLKRADRFLLEHVGEPMTIARLAAHCDVSVRTLEKAFADFRSVTPVAHLRNVRLDRAHAALAEGDESVAAIATRYGFRSPTTFALEYRKRFGVAPSRTRRRTRE